MPRREGIVSGAGPVRTMTRERPSDNTATYFEFVKAKTVLSLRVISTQQKARLNLAPPDVLGSRVVEQEEGAVQPRRALQVQQLDVGRLALRVGDRPA